MTHPVDDNSQSREARQQALSQLAAQHQGGQATSSTENYRERVIAAPRRRQLWQRPQLWLALLVVLSVIGGAFWRLHASATAVAKQQIRTIALAPASSEMDCPHDMAWSPDGTTLAVLGYQAGCSFVASTNNVLITNPLIPISVYNHIPGLINLYSTKSGALLAKIQPDAAILAHIKIPAAVVAALNAATQPPNALLGINYTHILWSADGHRLALTFSLYDITDLSHGDAPNHLPPGIAYDGLLLMQRDGTQPQVCLHQTDPRHPAAIIWNVSTGQALSATVESSGATTFTSLAPALSYQWNADGTLSLQTPLTSTIPPSPTAGAIGALDGGASFSIWQSGFVFDSLQGRPSGQRDLSNVPSYSTDLASWSPDGRYLAERIDITGLLQMAGQAMSSSNAQTLASYGWGRPLCCLSAMLACNRVSRWPIRAASRRYTQSLYQ